MWRCESADRSAARLHGALKSKSAECNYNPLSMHEILFCGKLRESCEKMLHSIVVWPKMLRSCLAILMLSHVSALLVRHCFSFKFTFSLLFLIAFSYSSCPFITVLNVARKMADHFKAASPGRRVLEGCVTYIELIDLLFVITGINLCSPLRYYMYEYVGTSNVFIPSRTYST